jgi:hypothetical protein
MEGSPKGRSGGNRKAFSVVRGPVRKKSGSVPSAISRQRGQLVLERQRLQAMVQARVMARLTTRLEIGSKYGIHQSVLKNHSMTQLLSQLRKAGLTLAAGALIAIPFTSCSSGLDGTQTSTLLEAENGFASVETFQAVATVTAINPATRKLGLLTSDGKRKRITCGPEVVNFDQIKVNDRIEYTVIQKAAVFVGDREAGVEGDSVTSLARIGDKPGVKYAETMSATALIKEVNTSTRKVTLELGDGSQRIVTADKGFDLSKVKAGKSVTLEYTEVISLLVKAP